MPPSIADDGSEDRGKSREWRKHCRSSIPQRRRPRSPFGRTGRGSRWTKRPGRWIPAAPALDRLAAVFAHLKYPRKAARYALEKRLVTPFVEQAVDPLSGEARLRFLNEYDVFTSWTGTRWVKGPRGPVTLPVATAVRLTLRQMLYALVLAVWNDRPDRPQPTSRQTRSVMTKTSVQTQCRAERKLGIAVRENSCLLPPGAARPGRRLIRVPVLGCLAYQISNSTDVLFGSVPPLPSEPAGTITTPRPGRIYFDDDADAVAYAQALGRHEDGYVFVGYVTVDGREVGLWRTAGQRKSRSPLTTP
jgi:hypothetical protein